MEIVYDAIVISDLHLGSDICQAKQIATFLESIHRQHLKTKTLILNGDVFDSWDFRRLKKSHWKVLSILRNLSDEINIIWNNGNHDGPAEIISHLLGVHVAKEYIFQTGDRKVIALHGDTFDSFISDHPIITYIADCFYRWIQKFDKSFYWSKRLKRASKTFLRCSERVQEKAKEYAYKRNCHIATCGHTHLEVADLGEISYFNSGCWTELPCSYLTFHDGRVELKHFQVLDF